MNKCEGCRFWEVLDYEPEDPHHVGAVEDWKGELLDSAPGVVWGGCDRENNPGSRMGTHDGSDYVSGLTTRQDFGCVQWEAKP